MSENYPTLVSCKPLKEGYEGLKKINITSEDFSLGRGLSNSVVVPFLAISRRHCVIRKSGDNDWALEDHSSFGIEINGHRLGRGHSAKLTHEDIINLEPSKEFVYRFNNPKDDPYETPKKRIKLEAGSDDLISNIQIKFEESQNYERKHIEDRIFNAQQMQTTSMILKERLQVDMDRKMKQLEADFALQIENLNGEKNEVERQKALLLDERDAQLSSVRQEMEGKIAELMEQIQKHNETESELLQENNLLKEKLLKEREEFLSELNRETTSKQDLMMKLEAKVKEQEEIRLKEKQELELVLREETEQLRLAKEKELKDLEEQKQKRELELTEELNNIKKDLEMQAMAMAAQQEAAEERMREQQAHLTKIGDEEKVKMEALTKEHEEIQRQLTEAQEAALKSREVLEAQVKKREVELAALAHDRIEQQAALSSVAISSLQDQLEKVKCQLQSVETEKNTLLESICHADGGEGSSKQTALAEVGELMESELQCSICAELFVAATTLNCSHTFCKYCITMWKKKKKDCPICRAPISSECKSLVLDSFIEKMTQNLTEEMKNKRKELLKSREELERDLAQQTARRSNGDYEYSGESESSHYDSVEEEEDHYGSMEYDSDDYYRRRRYHYGYSETDNDSDLEGSEDASDGGSDGASDSGSHHTTTSAAATSVSGAGAGTGGEDHTGGAGRSNNDDNGPGDDTRSRRRRERVAGLPGSYYGGYGRCFNCGARGHWAPGCPNR